LFYKALKRHFHLAKRWEELMPHKNLRTLALDRIKNRYLLTTLIFKRVNQLKKGAKPLIEADGLTPYDIALKEIVEGKVTPGAPPSSAASGSAEKTGAVDDPIEVQPQPPDSVEPPNPQDIPEKGTIPPAL
jgi:DNA-directed RNA polymerase subunit K/omega